MTRTFPLCIFRGRVTVAGNHLHLNLSIYTDTDSLSDPGLEGWPIDIERWASIIGMSITLVETENYWHQVTFKGFYK